MYYDNGTSIKDIDYGHDHGQGSPHVHEWDWTKPKNQERGDGRPPKAGECDGK